MDQIRWRTTAPKCDPTKLHSNFIEITLQHGSYTPNPPHTPRTLPHKKNPWMTACEKTMVLMKKKCNSNTTKYCIINLNAGYRLKKIQEMTQAFL